ncbi:FAD:protein FMN transferase [Allochromatium vinosum]|uniref:FAD:protein FMN transferase n=1 Tax=Allochromatium vinosum (strain ATCC 17899 / DSM 180 / NBRC 103801 / NCIMB 10441 / D) TaxID=572477 RepID=D3RVJ1_ALLVD|nr:FAD:protein FMN transferase [Allochromatium vinosum]ADC61118.1 ApbE family lipoprotein [Allochromatium vinosum DSM 180]
MPACHLVFKAMGSPCELHLHGPDAAETRRVAESVIADVQRLERRYSRYRDDSLTSAINRVAAVSGRCEVDAETAALLDYADTCYRESDGLFDITSGVLRRAWRFENACAPEPEAIAALLDRVGWDRVVWKRPFLSFGRPGMEIDFGGIGKEYAADRAAALCLDAGIRNGLINLGGDVRVIGPLPDGDPWRIGIRDPERPETLLGGVLMTGGALATSGDYARFLRIAGRRYGHILDPRTGWPVLGLVSVSVIAASCLVAGSLSTIAMLRGRAGIEWLRSLDIPHLWIDAEGGRGGSGVFADLLKTPG